MFARVLILAISPVLEYHNLYSNVLNSTILLGAICKLDNSISCLMYPFLFPQLPHNLHALLIVAALPNPIWCQYQKDVVLYELVHGDIRLVDHPKSSWQGKSRTWGLSPLHPNLARACKIDVRVFASRVLDSVFLLSFEVLLVVGGEQVSFPRPRKVFPNYCTGISKISRCNQVSSNESSDWCWTWK
jgi:hypothetical protein